MAQSLARRDDLADVTGRYGLVVVDECHHVPAVTFERAVREIPVRCWVGLTATPYRRDGLQAMMAMHCGPTRHHIKAIAGSALHRLDLVVHDTSHQPDDADGLHIQEVFRGLVEDDERTGRICDDIAVAVVNGRNCLVLTRWKDHLERIVEGLRSRGQEPLVLHGGMGKKARAAVVEELGRKPSEGGLLLARAKDSTAPRSTRSTSPSRSDSREASSSTSGESCGPPTPRTRSKSMTTSTGTWR